MSKNPKRNIVTADIGDDDGQRPSCFVIMPISGAEGYPAGHFGEVYEQLIRPAVEEAGFECSRATSTNSAHMIQLDIVTKVVNADLCICDLSNNNPNVLFEYGIRQAFDKPSVLLKDDRTRRIFDLTGFRDIEYDHTLRIANVLRAREELVKAIHDTVNAEEDGAQVFSLVKMMRLASAAKLPTNGDLDPRDARLELIESKIDRVVSSLSRPAPRPANTVGRFTGTSFATVNLCSNLFGSITGHSDQGGLLGDEVFEINNRWILWIGVGGLRISDREDPVAKPADIPKGSGLSQYAFWHTLTNDDRKRILDSIARKFPSWGNE